MIDYGDCELDIHQPTTIFDDIESHASQILKSDAKMVSLGGDHSITYPLLKAHAKKYGPITLIQFDAHCDTWADDGKRFDHGTMFARAANEGIIDVTKSTQIGLRTYCISLANINSSIRDAYFTHFVAFHLPNNLPIVLAFKNSNFCVG